MTLICQHNKFGVNYVSELLVRKDIGTIIIDHFMEFHYPSCQFYKNFQISIDQIKKVDRTRLTRPELGGTLCTQYFNVFEYFYTGCKINDLLSL